MKKISIFILAITFFTFSCGKDNEVVDPETTETSFTMTYDGVTYTKVDVNSLVLINGAIAIAGTEDGGFGLTLIGIGADGTTTNICTDFEACSNMCTATLDFGAVEGKEALVATSGTIKRTGKKLEINVSGITTSLETRTLTATIVVANVLDL